MVHQLLFEKCMGSSADRNTDLSGRLVLHLVEGVLAEVERMTRQHATAEAELTRLSAKVTALEAELAQLRTTRLEGGGNDSHNSFDRFFNHWTSFRTGVREMGARIRRA
jgi:hypothetical protein